MATRIDVNLPGECAYSVRIGAGILASLGRNLRGMDRFAQVRDVLVITDDNVGPLYLGKVRASLADAGFKAADIAVPAGERSKSLDVAGEIWSAMAQMVLGRDCLVVALGGGVVGDLAGFVASAYMRGVPVVHVPTTLLSMVDSSVGGKTAVDLPEGKNLVGTFHQPSFVCADTDVLDTLPEREWRCGCGEIAKSAVIDSDEFFFWLMDGAASLAARDAGVTAEAIARCVVFKAGVVAQDVTETAGVRECLNYGHTLGHAIEACTGYGAFSHGECVAEGMRFAARLAADAASGMDDGSLDAFAAAQDELLAALGLPKLAHGVDAGRLMDAMRRDKKARGGRLRFVLANDVARWEVVHVPDEVVARKLEEHLA